MVLKRFQDIDEFKNPHFPCNFFVQTEFDDSSFTWKWKSGQEKFESVRTSKVCNTLFKTLRKNIETDLWTYECKMLPHEPDLKNVITIFQFQNGDTSYPPVRDSKIITFHHGDLVSTIHSEFLTAMRCSTLS